MRWGSSLRQREKEVEGVQDSGAGTRDGKPRCGGKFKDSFLGAGDGDQVL